MWTSILFVFGFFLLIKGADFLVEGSSSIARRLKISDLVIGLTVVAFGTSSPELFVNTFANAQGNTAIAVRNIVGSNILFFKFGVPGGCNERNEYINSANIITPAFIFFCIFFWI